MVGTHAEEHFSPDFKVAHINYPYNARGLTDHTVDIRTADCFCEPKIRTHNGPYNGVPSPFILIDHQPIVRDNDFLRNLFDPTTRFLDTIKSPPAEGWDAVMDREKVERLLSEPNLPAVERIKASLEPLAQAPGETVEEFSARINARATFIASFLDGSKVTTKAFEPETPITQAEFERNVRSVMEEKRHDLPMWPGDDVEMLFADDSDLTSEDEFEIEVVDEDENDEEGMV